MRLDVSQQLRLQQQMKLSPRIIQAMEILQLPMLALQERIEAELEANPVLQQKIDGLDEQAPPAKIEELADRGEHDMVVAPDADNSDDFERLADFTAEYGPDFVAPDAPLRRPGRAGERDRKLEAMANAPAPGQNLNDYLLQQWAFVEAAPEVKAAGSSIIAFIDADGYLRTPIEELQQQTDPPTPADVLTKALELIWTLDPIGIGARDLAECLLLQLASEARAGRDVTLETELVEHFLRDIELNRLPDIARKTGRDIERIKQAIENLSHLNPRPGSLIGQRTVPVILPDIIVESDGNGQPVVMMAEGNTPHLSISRSYRRLARNLRTDQEAKQFLRKNIRSAQWLIGAIAQRRHTVNRVAEEVFKVQKDFLERGEEALQPLPMADVAKKVNVHVATVSRAVAGKYVQTPRGIYPLRMFFSGGKTTADGKLVAWDAIRVKLREIVDAEDKTKPLNDDDLAAEMVRNGCKIARRTVAKYRKLLNIPSARKRRQF